MTKASHRVGIDVGGSAIKGALVDVETGQLLSARLECPTPADFERSAVLDAIDALARRIDDDRPVGVGLPCAIKRGVVMSPPTADEHPGWLGEDVAAALTQLRHGRVRVANDADVAGLAEMGFGAGRGRSGLVLMLTLGTGIGSALFHRGELVPNTELGKLYLRSHDECAELEIASRVKRTEGLSWDEWSGRLATYLDHVDRLFTPELIVLGGGISHDADRFLPSIRIRAELRAAEMENDAGIVGAALLAASS